MKTVFLNVCVLVAASLIFAQDEPDKPAGATQGTYEVSPASGGPCTDEFFPPRLCATEAASDFGMVATGSPEATLAAVDILERGGNAIDAAVAAAFMMGVVDSDSSGIGGMTHIVIHLANGRTFAIDGTSNSPLSSIMRIFAGSRRADEPTATRRSVFPRLWRLSSLRGSVTER